MNLKKIQKSKMFSITILGMLAFLLTSTFIIPVQTAKAEYYHSPRGRVTWYDHTYGDHGNVLTNYDCATKKSNDYPDSNTPIYVTNSENGTKGTLYKNDWGSLPNAILDIRLYAMKYIFKTNAGYTTQGAPYGEFKGYYHHF